MKFLVYMAAAFLISNTYAVDTASDNKQAPALLQTLPQSAATISANKQNSSTVAISAPSEPKKEDAASTSQKPVLSDSECNAFKIQIATMIKQIQIKQQQISKQMQVPLETNQLVKVQLRLRCLQEIRQYLGQIIKAQSEKPCDKRLKTLSSAHLQQISNFVQESQALIFQVENSVPKAQAEKPKQGPGTQSNLRK